MSGAPSSGTPRESRANFRGPCGDCRRVLWVPDSRGQYSRKICFIEKRGVQDDWGRHVVKHSFDTRQAYPDVKLQGRDLMRVVGIIATFAPLGASTRGKFVLSSPGGGNGPRRCVPGALSSGTPRGSRVNFRVGAVWGL